MAYTTIDDPSAYFQTLLYTGDGSSSQAQTNTGNSDLQPDWIWVKKRNDVRNTSNTDSSRGFNKRLETQTTGTESTTTTDVISAQSNGFTVGNNGSTGNNGDTYVAWQWKANGGTTSSNTDGSITSTVQANTTAGFSVVTYTGNGADTATVGHGLSTTPKMILIKRRDSTTNWIVYHNSLTSASNYLNLNLTDAEKSASNIFDDTAPTSSVFTLGFSAAVNANTGTFVAYCFAEKQGYSKFGSYTGNANADGPMVFCGFKPAWLLIKETGNANDWRLQDAKRSPVNQVDISFESQTSNPETDGGGTFNGFDFLSNGFKVRTSNAGNNRSGGTYIYMAFAEHPFVSSEGVPTTAR